MDIVTMENFWTDALCCDAERVIRALADLSASKPDGNSGTVDIGGGAHIEWRAEKNTIVTKIVRAG